MRNTTGETTIVVGNATTNATAHEYNQRPHKPASKPEWIKVNTNDMMHDIKSDMKNGK